MLTTIVSTTAATASATATAISMTSTVGLAFGGLLATAALILLLSAKEIFSASEFYDRGIDYLLNTSILPLLIAFSATVVFKILEVLAH
ncbi:MAG: hypothetical protein QXJ68_07880 [Methanocellales archaeon]